VMTPEKNKKKPTFVLHSVRVSMDWFLDVPRTVEKKWSAKGASLENLGGDLGVVRRGGWWFRAFPRFPKEANLILLSNINKTFLCT
jgi:hypothetical protein